MSHPRGMLVGAILALPVPGHHSGLRQQVKGRKGTNGEREAEKQQPLPPPEPWLLSGGGDGGGWGLRQALWGPGLLRWTREGRGWRERGPWRYVRVALVGFVISRVWPPAGPPAAAASAETE